jgi:thioredoxin 2
MSEVRKPYVHVVCPQCHSTNRLPADRLGAGGKCGRCRGPLFQGEPLALDQAELERHLTNSDIPIVVDFWAAWCGPCQMMAPTFAAAAARIEPRARLIKVDTERNQQLAMRYGIRSIPTMIVFKSGREHTRISGALPPPQLLSWIEQNIH